MNFDQRVELVRYGNRRDYFADICREKRVLHVGCADPGISRDDSLHAHLAPVCEKLDGLDVVDDEFARSVGILHRQASEIGDDYDLMIVPEVVEHVSNLGQFLTELDEINFHAFIVTAPNAFMEPPILWNTSHYDDAGIIEVVHPDHKCWFSPYTLTNTIRSLTSWHVVETFILERSMIGVSGVKRPPWSKTW